GGGGAPGLPRLVRVAPAGLFRGSAVKRGGGRRPAGAPPPAGRADRRRGRGAVGGRLAGRLEGLRPHNLMTFKSHHEALDGWALKELTGADVAYRKLVSPSPSKLFPDDQFGLHAVSARFPHNLAGPVPRQPVPARVDGWRWAPEPVRVIGAGELPREAHNAPLPLFSASPALVGFGRSAYQRRSEQTSRLLEQLFERLRGEGIAVSYTMDDFNRQYAK